MQNIQFLFLGVLLVILCAIFVAFRVNTLLFGLTWLSFFAVFSSTLLGFAHAFLTGASLEWYTSYHAEVVQYSIFGCLAMLCGIGLGWRAWLPRHALELINARWLNSRFGLFLFAIGVLATVALLPFGKVATLNTGLALLMRFQEFGLVVLLIDSFNRRKWTLILVSFSIYVPLSIAGALASGHTPAKLELLIPAACIVAAWKAFNFRSLVLLAASGMCFFVMFFGWMQSRSEIRSGNLNDLSFQKAAGLFVADFVGHATDIDFDATVVNERIRERIDMTNILSQQVAFQPGAQPFVYGATFLDSAIALVPRAFWAGKPVIAGGSAFVERFTGIRRATDDTTSVGLSYPFEFYANGGTSWVIVGLFIVGFITARLELIFKDRSLSLPQRLALLSVLLTLSGGGQRMDVVLPSIVAGGLAAWTFGFGIEKFQPNFVTFLQGLPRPTPIGINKRRASRTRSNTCEMRPTRLLSESE
jgi:hypothetical protein